MYLCQGYEYDTKQNDLHVHVPCASSELGATLPQADSLQEAIILMLTEKVESLMQKIDEAEKDYQSCLASG